MTATTITEIHGLADAQAALATTQAAREAIRSQSTAANAAVTDAKAARAAIVQRIAAGESVTADESNAAAMQISAAEAPRQDVGRCAEHSG